MPINDVRVGVYVCHCGGNISDTIDVRAVAAAASKLPNVVISKEYTFMCSDPGQSMIVEDIRAGKINRVVVAACAPALHELTFRKALIRAGLNPYLFEHVNIREQASWVHKNDKAGATTKAIKLVAAGAAKISLQEPLDDLLVEAIQNVVVIGGGIAGIQASLALSKRNFHVHLIEKSPHLGGKLRELYTLYPDGESAADFLAPLLAEVAKEKNLTVHLKNEIEDITGNVGNFTVRTNLGTQIPSGAIVIATGYENYQPATGELGFGSGPAVITLPQLHSILKEDTAQRFERISTVAFIHCVGSSEYCSRVCCTATLHAVQELKRIHPHLQISDVYQDIRTYGRGHEEIYDKASKYGTTFFRYEGTNKPEVKEGVITVQDVLTWNEKLEIPADLIILSTGVIPSPIPVLVEKLRLPIGLDRFLLEAHPKLRPVEIASTGIFLAGSCQGPMDVRESSAAAHACASKVSALLGSGRISLDPFVARVNPSTCDGCGICLSECSYPGAIKMIDTAKGKRAEVTPVLCKGCGACAAVCPHRSIEVAGWSLDQYDAMIDAIVEAEDT